MGDTLLLNVETPFASYLWQDNSKNPYFKIDEPGNYNVQITSRCFNHHEYLTVDYISCYCQMFIPNAFSPNSDNVNDSFFPKFDCNMESYQLTIYNSWGEEIFETTNPKESWDGTFNSATCPSGVYTYVIVYKAKHERFTKRYGKISLIR